MRLRNQVFASSLAQPPKTFKMKNGGQKTALMQVHKMINSMVNQAPGAQIQGHNPPIHHQLYLNIVFQAGEIVEVRSRKLTIKPSNRNSLIARQAKLLLI